MKTFDDIVQRLRGEYLEMPGLRLTPGQVQRLCGIEPRVCQAVLDALVDAKFLATRPDGHYARLTAEQISQRSAASLIATELLAPHVVDGTHSGRFPDRQLEQRQISTGQGNGSDLRGRSYDLDELSPSDRGNGHEMLVARQPERRRGRSDVEMRTERATLERRWKEEHPSIDDAPTPRPPSIT
jgi:hypothetical protein